MSDNIQEVLDGCLLFSVKRLDRALDKFTEEAFREIGMSHSYALVLFILNQENGKRYKDLANILCIAPPSLTKIIDKLATRDFVAIARDGRTKRVYITDRGREIVPIIGEVFHKTRADNPRALFDWTAKQTYIALGNMMTSASMIGIDSCPIEGFNYDKVNAILAKAGIINPDKEGIASMVSFGYRLRDPKHPRSRKPKNEVITWLE